MRKTLYTRCALSVALAVLPWFFLGCGESAPTTMPAEPPPPQIGADGKPVPPPTAAGNPAPQK